jgi:hypothetical protein
MDHDGCCGTSLMDEPSAAAITRRAAADQRTSWIAWSPLHLWPA